MKCVKGSRKAQSCAQNVRRNVRDTNVELHAWCWRHDSDGGIVQPKRSAKGPDTDASGGTGGCQVHHGQEGDEEVACQADGEEVDPQGRKAHDQEVSCEAHCEEEHCEAHCQEDRAQVREAVTRQADSQEDCEADSQEGCSKAHGQEGRQEVRSQADYEEAHGQEGRQEGRGQAHSQEDRTQDCQAAGQAHSQEDHQEEDGSQALSRLLTLKAPMPCGVGAFSVSR